MCQLERKWRQECACGFSGNAGGNQGSAPVLVAVLADNSTALRCRHTGLLNN